MASGMTTRRCLNIRFYSNARGEVQTVVTWHFCFLKNSSWLQNSKQLSKLSCWTVSPKMSWFFFFSYLFKKGFELKDSELKAVIFFHSTKRKVRMQLQIVHHRFPVWGYQASRNILNSKRSFFWTISGSFNLKESKIPREVSVAPGYNCMSCC